ncbi:hypothetical protein [Paenibacillus oleatilyticus]|uniref:Uncharacterized protein n=1 Tax=Paenibacillus oleatilyticus TaxID=2594886 RepID=A0ABV4UUC9_9BACL
MFGEKVTPELWEAMQEFDRRFPDSCVPLEMIPSSETVEGLLMNIQKCFDANKDLLPELYNWKLDGTVWY